MTAGDETPTVPDAASPPPVNGVLRDVLVETRRIFGERAARGNPLRRLADATHWTTREFVVRREVWKRPGDVVDGAFARELERNLRATGLFAEAVVELVPVDGSDRVDLRIRTRDRLSISGGVSGSYVGSATSSGFNLAESNVFGMGDRLGFSYTKSDLGETRGRFAYTDRYLAGTWTTGYFDLGRTDEGDFAGFYVDRPLRYLDDDLSAAFGMRTDALDVEYFADDETIAEIPFDQDSGSARATQRIGERFDFMTRGLQVRYVDRNFGAPRGPAAAAFDVPEHTTEVLVGAVFGRTWIRRFDEVTGVDTLRFVEDVELSTRSAVELGLTSWDDDRGGDGIQPTFAVELSDRREPRENLYLSTEVRGEARFADDEAVGWQVSARAAAFERRFEPHTLAFNAFYLQGEEDQGLPLQLTLGEGSGLRGYPRRQFTGTRVVGVNLEDRIDLDASLGALDFGAAVFFDAGWASSPGDGFGRPFTSAGAGLRIGSNRLLGRGILRLDVSVPLDEVNGESLDPLFSFSLGQAFGL